MYKSEYEKAIKYMHEENIFSYPEGHQLHESNIHAYTDWLQEHGKDAVADVIRHHVENKKPDDIDNLNNTYYRIQDQLDSPGTHSHTKEVLEKLANAYKEGTPVVTPGYKRIYLIHSNPVSNKIHTYIKDVKDGHEVNNHIQALKDEGVMEV